MKSLALIFAIARNGVIGKGGQLPWHYPEDRAHFLRTTERHAVIMGRRTWEERGTPLKDRRAERGVLSRASAEGDRTNIVVSSTLTREQVPPGVIVAPSLDDALTKAWEVDEQPFVIGGVRLFEEAMPRATRIYVTEIPGEWDGDTVLRSFDARANDRFRVVSEELLVSGLRFLLLEPR